MKDFSGRKYTIATLIVKLTAKLSINLSFNTAHMGDGPMKYHGPQTWPWWRLVAPRIIKLDTYQPTTGRRLWLYTRWGAYYADFILDRRRVVKKLIQGSIR